MIIWWYDNMMIWRYDHMIIWSYDHIIISSYYRPKIQNIFGFKGRKMKCWGSSETRFDQVPGQSEPSSGGKRTFKVRKTIRRKMKCWGSSETGFNDPYPLPKTSEAPGDAKIRTPGDWKVPYPGTFIESLRVAQKNSHRTQTPLFKRFCKASDSIVLGRG